MFTSIWQLGRTSFNIDILFPFSPLQLVLGHYEIYNLINYKHEVIS